MSFKNFAWGGIILLQKYSLTIKIKVAKHHRLWTYHFPLKASSSTRLSEIKNVKVWHKLHWNLFFLEKSGYLLSTIISTIFTCIERNGICIEKWYDFVKPICRILKKHLVIGTVPSSYNYILYHLTSIPKH